VSQAEGDAKGFFVDAIVSQAEREGTRLSDNERWMLRFSESDPEFVVDPSRMSEFEAEISDSDYESKIAGLIGRAYEHDVATNSGAAAFYRDARDSLTHGDHYLLIMIDRALKAQLRPALAGRVAKSGMFLILVPVTALAVLIAAGLAGIVLTGQTHSAAEAWPFVLGFLFFAFIIGFLVRLMVREARA
jgi:hypothetical protein